MQSDEILLTVLLTTFAFVLLAGVFWYVTQRQKALMKARLQRVETFNRLIEKFATAKEVVEFLETEQGKKLMEDPLPPTGNPRFRVLRFVRFGVVFLLLGPAFLIDAYLLRNETEINYIYKAKDLQFWGISTIALGIGLLAVAFLTNVLIKRWGLEGPRGDHKQ